MKTCHKRLIGAVLVVLASGCANPQLKLSTEPPANIDRTRGRDISAGACGFQLFQLIPMGTNERQQKAYDELKGLAGADYIGDVSVTEDWYYGVIGSVYCTTYKAKAYPNVGA